MPNPSELLELLDSVKAKIKKSDVIIDMCKEYDVDVDYIDLIPMYFDDFDVSGRTNHGIIYFNYKLLERTEDLPMYAVHEIKHNFQQCFSDGPTKGANDGEYLDNKFEQEGFQAQTEYISDTKGDEAAEKYIDKVLDHHDIDKKKERDKRKKQLLQLASGQK